MLHPDAWSEYRDRGLALAALHQADRAMADLETYLAQALDALDAEAVAERLAQLRHQNS